MKKLILVSFLLLVAAININAQEIFDAVKANDLAKVKALVEKDTSLINLKDAAGNTPLHIAAIIGFVPIAEYLLSKG
ncbi:MAG: ankyrin repeat domain-containing protein, partial [Candidatus Aenigmarchaeota archaeon]|nr:ankyrin repeat domain-containing protein [Candidatus Aenigmarchaeota archaeon]